MGQSNWNTIWLHSHLLKDLTTQSPTQGFAQSPPLVSYIGGAKEEAFHLSIESSIGGSWTSITNKNSYNIILTLWVGTLKGRGGLQWITNYRTKPLRTCIILYK
jgi:hypothetical protein